MWPGPGHFSSEARVAMGIKHRNPEEGSCSSASQVVRAGLSELLLEFAPKLRSCSIGGGIRIPKLPYP